MPKIGEISINVTGKTDNLKRALKDGERATKDFSDKVKKSGHDAERAIEGIGKSLSTAQSALVGFVGGLGSGAAMAGLNAISQGVRGLTSAIIDGNAEFERYTMQFEVLLGGAAKAKQRLQELAKFGRDTPFELPEVVRASKVLQSFGGDLLATGESLRLVGDAASMAGVSIDELAVWVGRFYGSLKEGKPAGEALQRFRELAIITPEFTQELEKLVKTNGSAAAAWQLFEGQLGRAKGLMNEQSKTWDGMWSNMIDQVKEFARVVGKPFFDAAKEGLKATLDWFNSEGGQQAQKELRGIAEEIGGVLKEAGPKFIKTAGEGLVKFIKWVASDDAKQAIENLATTAKWIGAIYVALKGIEGVKNLQGILGGLGGAAGGGGSAASAAGAAGWLGRAGGWVTAATVAGVALVENSKGISPTLFSNQSGGTTSKSFGYDAAEALRGDGRSLFNDPVTALRTGSWTPQAVKPYNPFGAGLKLDAFSKAQPKKNGNRSRTGTGVSNTLNNRLGSGIGLGRGGRSGGGSKSGGGEVNWDPFGIIAMVEESFKVAEEFARDQWEEFTRRMQDLAVEGLRLRGGSDADVFRLEVSQGRHADLSKEQQDAIEAKMRENEATRSQVEWSQAFVRSKKEEIGALREMAKELGQGNAIEGFLKNIENAQDQIEFGFWQGITRAFLENAAAQKRQAEASHQAKLAIAELKQEMGEMAKPTEFSRMLGRVWGGDLKDANAADKQSALDMAKRIDKWREWKELQAPIEEQTKRYNDTLRDLALRLSLVGASSEEARMQLELLSQGMTTGQAQSIVFIQRQISELEKLRDISERAADGLTSALMDSFSQIRNGAGAMFQSLVQGFRQTLAEMAQEYLRSMIRDILKNFIFSAFRRSAGSGDGFDPVTSSLGIAPRAPAVAPSAPSAPVVVNMTVNTPDVGGFLRAQGQIAQKMIQTGARAQRRNG